MYKEGCFLTAVEFYDRTPVENIISSVTTAPDKIIFIGDGKRMKKFHGNFRAFLAGRGIDTKLEYRSINRHDLDSIVEVLTEIVENEDECVFDLTGGDDLALVAMGIVYQRYKDTKKLQMQRFNIRNGVVTDCDDDGTVIYEGVPELTVEENIMLHGGSIRKSEYDSRVNEWDLTEDFKTDVELMWEICRRDPGLWNTQLNVLAALDDFASDVDSLEVSVHLSNVEEHLENVGVKYVSVLEMLIELFRNELILDLQADEVHISYSYKNPQIKKCLTKAGNVLELKVLVAAGDLTEKDGSPYYTDSMSGVFIDWDGEEHCIGDDEKDTENEIDVILMKGMIPVFISCKNGQVADDELYKLDAVANRFGSRHVKKILIATYLGKKAQSMEYFRQRAKDMNITLIDGVHELDYDEFQRMIRNLSV